jgi:hypothetical protein
LFQDLIRRDGPNINPRVIPLKSKMVLKFELGINVKHLDIIHECKQYHKNSMREKIDIIDSLEWIDTN